MKVLTVSSVGTAQSGSGSYAPNEIITLAETTAATQPTLTVTHTKLSSATVTGAGTGGTPGAATLTGTTGTGTKFQVAVTISGGGAISSINSVSVAGDYTVNPTLLTAEPVTGGGLAGATLNIKMGVLTATPTTLGVISSLAANPVPQGSTTGSGTGATFNLTYGVDSVVVGAAGTGYAAPPTVVFGSGAATAIAILSSTTDTVAFIFTDPTGAAINLPTSSYIVKALADEASFCEITSKTAAGFTLVVNPLDAEGLIAGHVDLSIEYTN
jgi:hypothetical protein